MSFYSIDEYYDVEFYKQVLEALKNNRVDFKEYISTIAPYNFIIECSDKPSFINYDEVPSNKTRFLVNLITPLTPSSAYIYERRNSIVNLDAVKHYAINDALGSAQITKEGIFFHATKEEILRISKEFPRKIYYFGRYFNNRYNLFFSDSLMIKNYINSEDILVESNNFKMASELETELNFKVFREKARLFKISETPYVINGRYYPISSASQVISKMYTLV